MPSLLFWFFALLTLAGGTAVIAFRNPVSSALAVVACFVGAAGLFLGLSAFFVAAIQILVYTGAVMVLFLFIIMLLDLKTESRRPQKIAPILAGLTLVAALAIQLTGVITSTPHTTEPPLDRKTLADASAAMVSAQQIPANGKIATDLNNGKLPDLRLVGHTLFTRYNLPLQILGTLLLVATIGAVTLSRKTADNP